VTKTGAHYLIIEPEKGRGEICRVEDFDPETRDFKPGAQPPAWAGGQHVKGPHKLTADGFKVPVQPAPSYGLAPQHKSGSSKRNGRGRTAPVFSNDEDVIDLSEETFTDKEFKETQDKAEVEATDVAGDVAASFRRKLRKK
jgi:hypothetical protein